MKRIITSILILLLVVAIAVAIVVNYNNGKEEKALLARVSEENIRLNAKKSNLQREKEDYIELRDAETKYGRHLVLFFDNLRENLYDEVYPLLDRYGYKGTIVMCDGLLPGAEGNISREHFDFLLAQGWDIAIGGTAAIDMKDAAADELLDNYLTEYTAALTEEGIDIPLTFCFGKGDYDNSFKEVLKKHGFKIIRHFGETGEVYGSTVKEDDFYYVGSGLYCAANTALQSHVDKAYEEDLTYTVSVRYVQDEATDVKKDCTVIKYQRMLSYINNNCPELDVCTVSELYNSKLEQLNSVSTIIGQYNQKISVIDEQIAQIDEDLKRVFEMIK